MDIEICMANFFVTIKNLSHESKTTLLLVLGLLSSTMCSKIIFAYSHAQLLLFDSPPPEYWQAIHLEFEQEGEAEIFFVPFKFGVYDFSVKNHEGGAWSVGLLSSDSQDSLPCPDFVYFTTF